MAQKPLHVFAHHSPSKTKEELEQCWLNVRSLLQRDTPWNEEALGLYYRTLCIPPMHAQFNTMISPSPEAYERIELPSGMQP